MKAILLYLSLLFTLSAEYARGQCLQNPDFADYCGTTLGPSCPYFDYPCVPNWSRSHGSPQIFPGTPSSLNVAYMWADHQAGEGLFAGYTFVPGKMYTLTIRANATGPSNGSLRLYATNNLTEPVGTGCGGFFPTLSPSQQIPVTLLVNQGWMEYSATFTANNNYSQLLMYPVGVLGGAQMNLYVDYVTLCPAECVGTITYNLGIVPSGETRAKYIIAGSSAGGSGTVTIAPGTNTNFVAGTEISLVNEFSATVTGTGEFTAKIVVCNDGGASRVGLDRNISPGDRNIDITKFRIEEYKMMAKDQQQEKLLLYPNPVRNVVTAEFFLDPADPVELKVMTATGSVVRTMKRSATSVREIQRVQIPLTGLSKGIYFVQMISKKGSVVRKIEKLE